MREGDGETERGGRIMCRILDKLSGIPTGHSHCLWNLIGACHQLTFKKPYVPSLIVKSGQFWVNDSFIMMCVCAWDSVRRFDLQKRGDSRRFGLSSPPIQRECRVGADLGITLYDSHVRCEIHATLLRR